MQKIAVFGGTFNPIHGGHLLIAEAAFDQFALDRVLWVPSRLPPHKLQPLVEFEHRLAMVRLAIAHRPYFTASDIEARRDGISWAIDTFHDLQAVYPHAQWFWIIGADAFENLAKWRASQELSDQCVWLVAPRGEGEERAESSEENREEKLIQRSKLKTQAVRSQWIQMDSIALSSSLIRQYCREGRSLHDLIPEPVRAYIELHNLYHS
jgi:nicotinate-nucleotide adenylyltransferase